MHSSLSRYYYSIRKQPQPSAEPGNWFTLQTLHQMNYRTHQLTKHQGIGVWTWAYDTSLVETARSVEYVRGMMIPKYSISAEPNKEMKWYKWRNQCRAARICKDNHVQLETSSEEQYELFQTCWQASEMAVDTGKCPRKRNQEEWWL
jgi:hypothetical protein